MAHTVVLFDTHKDRERKRKREFGKTMQGYTRLPVTLYRIQNGFAVKLRDYESQLLRNRTSFDLKLHNGLVLPVKPGSPFTTPNGMSWRPAGPKMLSILSGFVGNPTIFRMHEGLLLPDGLIAYNEHTDHWSLQTTKPITLEELNKKLTDLLSSLPHQSREQFLAQYEDEDDQDN